MDYADLHTSRFIHCHKIKKHFYVFEDYEMINGEKTLKHSTCPYYTGTATGKDRCDGLNDHGNPCGYARKQSQ